MTLDLEKTLSVPIWKKQVVQLAGELAAQPGQIKGLIGLTFHGQQKIAFRASWILESVYERYPELFEPFIADFVAGFAAQHNLSCKRHYTRIVMDMLHRKQPQLAQIDFEPLVEAAFEWLIDPGTPVAVQVNCLDILYAMQTRYPWIADELKEQTIFLLKNGTPAMQSRGKKILKKLR